MNPDTIIGFVNQLGYLNCRLCVGTTDREWTYPVYADNGAHNHETCDRCHMPLLAK